MAGSGFMDVQIKKGKIWPYGLSNEGNVVNLVFEKPVLSGVKSQNSETIGQKVFEPVIRIYNRKDHRFKDIPVKPEWHYNDVYGLAVSVDQPEDYGFQIRNGDQSLRLSYGCETFRINGETVYFLKVPNFDWGEDLKLKWNYDDIVLYKMHMKGWTKHISSGVEHRGTFEGAVEKIPYLKDLGINAIELMPIYDFLPKVKDKVTGENKNNYWGYGPAQYFAPKPEYAAHSGDAPTAFKTFVKECHRAGIEVYMEIFFSDEDSDACHLACLRHWVLNYHIDGFHLNGDQVSMKEVLYDPILSDVKVMSQHFNGSNDRNRSFCRRAVYHNGFLEVMRRFLRGDGGSDIGFREHMTSYSKGQGRIGYLTDHNGFTLMDLVSYDRKHNEDNGEHNFDGAADNLSWNCGIEGSSRRKDIQHLRRKQLKNACILTVLHQGTPMIYAGDEFGNSQKGNNNAWCQDNKISWLDWHLLEKNGWLHDWIKEVISIRKAHSCLHPKREFRFNSGTVSGLPECSYHGLHPWYVEKDKPSVCTGIMYTGKDEAFYFAYNMSDLDETFYLPEIPKHKEWEIFLDTSELHSKDEQVEKKVMVEQHSILLLHQQWVNK